MINKAKQVHVHFIFTSLLFHNLKDYIDTNRQGSTLEWFISQDQGLVYTQRKRKPKAMENKFQKEEKRRWSTSQKLKRS